MASNKYSGKENTSSGNLHFTKIYVDEYKQHINLPNARDTGQDITVPSVNGYRIPFNSVYLGLIHVIRHRV